MGEDDWVVYPTLGLPQNHPDKRTGNKAQQYDPDDHVDKNSLLEKWFRLKSREATLLSEFRGGLTGYFSIVYAMVLVPRLFSTAGHITLPEATAATVLTIATATLITGVVSNLPVVASPSVAVAAYVALEASKDENVTREVLSSCALIAGGMYLFLSLGGLKWRLLSQQIVPSGVRDGVAIGVGIHLTFVGLRIANLVVLDPHTGLTVGGCHENYRIYLSDLKDVFVCTDGKLDSLESWIALCSFGFMAVGVSLGIPGTIVFAISAVTAIAWATGIVQFPDAPYETPSFPSLFSYSVDLNTISWTSYARIVGTMLYLTVFQSVGVVHSVAPKNDSQRKRSGRLESVFAADAVGSLFGSIFGCPPSSLSAESGGVLAEGGKTGFASIVTALLVGASIFVIPLTSAIPPYATGPALALAGMMLMKTHMKALDGDVANNLPAVVTMAVIPLTSSVPYGVIAGITLSLAISILKLRWLPNSVACKLPQGMQKRLFMVTNENSEFRAIYDHMKAEANSPLAKLVADAQPDDHRAEEERLCQYIDRLGNHSLLTVEQMTALKAATLERNPRLLDSLRRYELTCDGDELHENLSAIAQTLTEEGQNDGGAPSTVRDAASLKSLTFGVDKSFLDYAKTLARKSSSQVPTTTATSSNQPMKSVRSGNGQSVRDHNAGRAAYVSEPASTMLPRQVSNETSKTDQTITPRSRRWQ